MPDEGMVDMGDVVKLHRAVVDIARGTAAYSGRIVLFERDKAADRLEVLVKIEGENADLTGYTGQAEMERPDGQMVMMAARTDGSKIIVELDEHCYVVEGSYRLAVKLKGTDRLMTVLLVEGDVEPMGDGEYVDTGEALIDLDELLALYDDMKKRNEESIQATNASAEATEKAEKAAARAEEAAALAEPAEAAARAASEAAEAANRAAGNANTEAQAASEAAEAANRAAGNASTEAQAASEAAEAANRAAGSASTEAQAASEAAGAANFAAERAGKAAEDAATAAERANEAAKNVEEGLGVTPISNEVIDEILAG